MMRDASAMEGGRRLDGGTVPAREGGVYVGRLARERLVGHQRIMGLPYHPKPGTIVICDYTTGFREPEMVKRRLAVIISPKLKRRNDLATVILLSESVPPEMMHWHMKINLEIPAPWGDGPRWAKADMLATVGYHRLNLPYTKHHVTGSRSYSQIELGSNIVDELRRCAAAALGIVIEN
ncbi:type II toxin-antitoxin system PemK/MazF family toxin [Sphingomonas abietis]|uniref:Type II toxin-antitoxin system PemK/MazF family toxin n=1 Tax=Sphingomonas abietis TaxID=3012344 RepID=A0ABY7NNB5_9SPHN|nr:type II toxin-antitoxin system PemK/MazF family toxin [Sphingomonas abietis]WBO22320.1 type II toxin-antitoxin system PemK/MazF family toxin [Sphingomonas abietis]